MRRRIEPLVREWWRGGGGRPGGMLRALTLPAELLYRGLTRLRNEAYAYGLFRVHRVPVPVISVGNLVVGGTGKTPVAAWLVDALEEDGHAPGLLARGYGDDEIRLHRRWNPAIPVHARPDRVAAAFAAVREGADVLVLDDGFQHRRLGRDFDLVLVAAEAPFPGRVLPRGPCREGPEALQRAHGVLVTRRTASVDRARDLADRIRDAFPRLAVGTVTLAAAGWADLEGRPREAPHGDLAALSSVATPEEFQRMVESSTGTRPRPLAFPDHHDFTQGDVAHIGRTAGPATLVTTEKDAVKLVAWADQLPPVRVLRLRVEPGPGADGVLREVLRAAKGGRGALGPGGRRRAHARADRRSAATRPPPPAVEGP